MDEETIGFISRLNKKLEADEYYGAGFRENSYMEKDGNKIIEL